MLTRRQRVRAPEEEEIAPEVGEVHDEIEEAPVVHREVAMANREVSASITPKTFAGKPYEDVDEFMRHFNRAARANNWTNETKLVQLPCYLTGTALKSFEAFEDACETFEDATAVLVNAFRREVRGEQNYFKLMSRRQGPTEDVWNYFHEMLNLCYEVNGDMEEAQKVGFIVRGLVPRLIEKVNLMNNDTTDQLKKNLEKIEVTAMMTSGTSQHQQHTEVERLRNRVSQLESQRRSNFVQGRTFNHYNNFGRGTQGFRSLGPNNREDFRQTRDVNVRQTHSYPTVKREPRTTEGRITCFRCNKVGHYARNCRSAPKN